MSGSSCYTYPDTCIIVFAKAPIPGYCKKRIARRTGNTIASLLQRRLVTITLHKASTSALGPVTLYCAPDTSHAYFRYCKNRFQIRLEKQQGSDLGERMHHALNKALEDFERVVLIGTDCPALTHHDLEHAISALDSHDMVIGPAIDGGYYLIGARTQCNRSIFSHIEWGTDAVYRQSLEKIRSCGHSLKVLRQLDDMDSPRDLQRQLPLLLKAI